MPLFWLCLFLVTPIWLIGSLALLLAFPSLTGKLAAGWTLLPLLGLWSARWRPRLALAVAALAVLALAGLLLVYPWPKPSQQVRSSPPFPTPLDLICNFVPESDLSALGVGLAYSDPRYDQVMGLLRPLYREMEADPQYARLPHVVGSTAQDLFLGTPGAPHYFCYVPPGEGKKPALIFFHGALGNFKVYLHFWRRWAQKTGYAVICPSNGFGRWYDEQGEKRALELFDSALAELPIDPTRVTVAGMSNGGTAVTRLVNARPDKIGSVLLICPVLEVGQTLTPTFLDWTRRHTAPIVLEGDEDINVSPEIVSANVDAILKQGGRCDLRLRKGHDHHILFSDAEEVYAAVGELAQKLELKTSGTGHLNQTLPRVHRK